MEPTPQPEEAPKPGESTVNLPEGDDKPAKKRRGRPKGSKNKKQRNRSLFAAWRALFWSIVYTSTVAATYHGVYDIWGRGAAYIAFAVTGSSGAYLLDRAWKKLGPT